MSAGARAATGSCSGWRPGVGKTYRMLQEGRQAQAEGRDVVIGYLEPHDRPETAALADGLEVVPRLRAQHGGARARGDGRRRGRSAARPSSRSSTSSRTRTRPGMRNEKRYQDIDEILDAGIDVISTVNVQHLESLNDAISELTGVRVRETFPDRILDEADEVVLVDLDARGAAGAAAGRQGLPARARRRRARELLPRRQPRPRCASSRCARSPRTSRRAARPPSSTRSASRRSPSACSRSSSRSRSRSGSCAAPGARPQRLGARDRRALGAQAAGSELDRRGADAARGAAPARGRPRRPLPRGGGRRPRRDRRARRRRARLDVRLRRHAGRVAGAREILARLAALAARPRAARASTSASSPNRADRGGARVVTALDDRRSPLVALLVALAVAATLAAPRRRPGACAAARGASSSRSPAAPRPDRARRGDPDRPRRGRHARPRLPADRPARVRRGLAAAGAGRGRDAAARGGRARRAPGRRPRRRPDREGPHADPRAAPALGGRALRPHRRARAPAAGAAGFTPKDLAWILTHAPAETLVLRPRPAELAA